MPLKDLPFSMVLVENRGFHVAISLIETISYVLGTREFSVEGCPEPQRNKSHVQSSMGTEET